MHKNGANQYSAWYQVYYHDITLTHAHAHARAYKSTHTRFIAHARAHTLCDVKYGEFIGPQKAIMTRLTGMPDMCGAARRRPEVRQLAPVHAPAAAARGAGREIFTMHRIQRY